MIGWLLLTICVSIILFVGMQQFVIGDASLYASISKRMYLQDDYFRLFLGEKPYLQKPHLLFWLSSLSFSVFGVNTLAFKLPSILIGLSGVFALYLFGKKAMNERVGFWAAFIWFFSLAFMLHTNDIHMDTMMTGFILWTAYFWLRFVYDDGIKWLMIGSVPLAFAMMTKGPLGAFVPVSGLVFALLAKGGFKEVFRWPMLLALLLVVILISPVLYSVYLQHGLDGLLFYAWENNAGRVERSDGGTKDVFFYMHTMAWFFLPWALLFIYAFGRTIHNFWQRKCSLSTVFAFGSFITFFVVASLADQQAPHYLYSLLPFAAFLTSVYANDDQHLRAKNILLAIPCVATFLLATVGLVIFPPTNFLMIVVSVCSFASAVLFASDNNGLRRLFLLNAVGITLLFGVVNIQLFQLYFQPHDAIVQAVYMVNETMKQGDKLYILDESDHHQARADFYANHGVQQISDAKELSFNESFFVISSERELLDLLAEAEPNAQHSFAYLLLTKPLKSVSFAMKSTEEEMPQIFLLDYTK